MCCGLIHVYVSSCTQGPKQTCPYIQPCTYFGNQSQFPTHCLLDILCIHCERAQPFTNNDPLSGIQVCMNFTEKEHSDALHKLEVFQYGNLWAQLVKSAQLAYFLPPPTHTHKQYFSTFDSALTPCNHVPWIPLSVICSPIAAGSAPNSKAAPHDEESSLKALLGQLGPKEERKRQRHGGIPQGEAVGGLVSCLLLPRDTECVGKVLKGVSKEHIQLQRIASRCHCQVFYVTYGNQVDTDSSEASPLFSVSLYQVAVLRSLTYMQSWNKKYRLSVLCIHGLQVIPSSFLQYYTSRAN